MAPIIFYHSRFPGGFLPLADNLLERSRLLASKYQQIGTGFVGAFHVLTTIIDSLSTACTCTAGLLLELLPFARWNLQWNLSVHTNQEQKQSRRKRNPRQRNISPGADIQMKMILVGLSSLPFPREFTSGCNAILPISSTTTTTTFIWTESINIWQSNEVVAISYVHKSLYTSKWHSSDRPIMEFPWIKSTVDPALLMLAHAWQLSMIPLLNILYYSCSSLYCFGLKTSTRKRIDGINNTPDHADHSMHALLEEGREWKRENGALVN
jgi:hypothetical protein